MKRSDGEEEMVFAYELVSGILCARVCACTGAHVRLAVYAHIVLRRGAFF